MIPPVLLNVHGNDRVLDMCAAPGSKTSQMLEDMSMTKTTTTSSSSGGDGAPAAAATAATGCLIANDSNTHRAYLLSHQLRRILYHHPVALITTCNAQNFPGLIAFDKILCDVPCSGDGTCRKNVDVWQKWANGGALGLHYLQLQIALRGVELLAVGGTMCYSTCSQNPVENEAVVAELLRTHAGCLELVESRHLLTGFATRPGRAHWKVLYEPKFEAPKKTAAAEDDEVNNNTNGESLSSSSSKRGDDGDPRAAATTATGTTTAESPKEGRPIFTPTSWHDDDLLAQARTVNLHVFASYDEVPEQYQKKVRRTVFPPTAAEAATMHLDRCLRCLPHDNNTGGFFTAILKKIAPMNNRLDRRTEETRAVKRQKFEAGLAAAATAEEPTAATNTTTAAAEEEEKECVVEEINLPPNEGRSSARQKDKLDKDNFVEAPDDIMGSIIDFYGLCDGFDRRLFHYRKLGEKNTLYYVSPQVKAVFDLGIQDRITGEFRAGGGDDIWDD
jgi:16S rRNA C967 or C1407 C5-methylase (RsmB/RsmF family)